MRTIVNDYIPFKGFKAINLLGVLFVRRGEKMKPIGTRSLFTSTD